ncbi:MAG TPA: discoidin domain-containing protein, partial [Candidatus Brocadiia bacterium]|nr:discoidin domain-containing protein [Candidatus Brocadiia bacterium]
MRTALVTLALMTAVASAQPAKRVDYATKAAGAKVTCSSELGAFRAGKHFAAAVIDGDTVGDYWCSDFQKGAKPPHWLEVDLGQERLVGEVVLFMVPRRGQTLNKFRIEAEMGGKWSLLSECLKAQDDPSEGGLAARYGDEAATFGVFRAVLPKPVTTRKVKLTIESPSTARLLEIQVFGPRPEVKAAPRKPVDASKLTRFDLGAIGSPVAPGWTGVTAKDEYTDALGYGWTGVNGLAGADRETGYDVTRDLVAGLAQAKTPARHTFRVKVPKGPCAVAVVSGDLDFAVPPFSIAAEGKVVAPRVGTGDRGGWDAQTFTVDVQDGILDLTFEAPGAWAANAILVAPVAQFADVLAEVQELEDQFARRDAALLKNLKERKPGESPGDLKTTPERTQRGYEVWSLPRASRIYPTTIPDEKAVTRALSVRATPGEYASQTFALRAFKPLRDVKVTATDLSGPAGRLPASVVSVGCVRFW